MNAANPPRIAIALWVWMKARLSGGALRDIRSQRRWDPRDFRVQQGTGCLLCLPVQRGLHPFEFALVGGITGHVPQWVGVVFQVVKLPPRAASVGGACNGGHGRKTDAPSASRMGRCLFLSSVATVVVRPIVSDELVLPAPSDVHRGVILLRPGKVPLHEDGVVLLVVAFHDQRHEPRPASGAVFCVDRPETGSPIQTGRNRCASSVVRVPLPCVPRINPASGGRTNVPRPVRRWSRRFSPLRNRPLRSFR